MFQLPERKEFLDNLRHLAHFSEKAILLSADSRGSVGHLVSALSAAEGDSLFLVDVDLAEHESVSQALRASLRRLQGDATLAAVDHDEQLLGQMQQYASRMAAAGQRVLLIFRSADVFGEERSIALVAALQASHDQESRWGVILASVPEFARALRQEPQAQSLLLPLHLKPLSRTEFGDYVALQLGALVPSEKMLDKHHKHLGGLPEKIDAFILGQRAQAGTAQAKASPLHASPEKPSPAKVGATPARSDAAAVKATTRPAPTTAGSASPGAPPPASAATRMPASDAPAPRQSLLRNRMLVLPVVVATLGTAVMAALFLYDADKSASVSEEAQVSAEPEVSPVASEAPAPVTPDGPVITLDEASGPSSEVAVDSPAAPGSGRASSADLVDRIQEQFVRQRASGGFAPEELAAADAENAPLPAETVEQAPTAPALADRGQLAARLLDGGERSQADLPPESMPSPSDPAPEPPSEPPPEPGTGEVERVDVESAPIDAKPEATSASGSDRFRSAEWLAQQPSEHWTIQMLGSYSESLVVRFLNTRAGLEKAVYIRSTYKNKPWFIVLNGSYATKAEAQRIVQALPGSLKKEDFWIRQIGGLK
ncbi:SPOR domain-containing protein [Allohahella marinimesophila]